MDILVGTLLAIVALEAVAIAGLILQGSRERARLIETFAAERSRLLDRIMARSYTDFVYATKPGETPATPQLTTDEAEAAWYAAAERERLKEVA